MIARIIRKKANLPSTFPSAALRHPNIYNLVDIEELQAKSKISELLIRLNSTNSAHITTIIRLANLQHTRWSTYNILEHPIKESTKPGQNLIADIINLMTDYKIKIIGSPNKYWSPALVKGGNWPIENILAPDTLYKFNKKFLKKENLLYLDQLLRYNKLVTWSKYTTHTRSTNKGKIPIWFKLIEERTINSKREIINTQWIQPTSNPLFKHHISWTPKQHNINPSMPEFDDLLDHNEIAIHIPESIRQQWNTCKHQLQKYTTHSIFTDGSVQNTISLDQKSGAAWITTLHDSQFNFLIEIQKISTTAEGFAILSALEAAPRKSNVKINTDSQAAISIISK